MADEKIDVGMFFSFIVALTISWSTILFKINGVIGGLLKNVYRSLLGDVKRVCGHQNTVGGVGIYLTSTHTSLIGDVNCQSLLLNDFFKRNRLY